MTPGPAAEATPHTETTGEREHYSPSPALEARVALGRFTANSSIDAEAVGKATEVSKNSYDALQAKHNDLRKQDDQRRNALVREQLRTDTQRAEAIRADLAAKKGVNPDQISKTEIEYHATMEGWADAEKQRIFDIKKASDQISQTLITGALIKIHVLKSVPGSMPDFAFYDRAARKGGDFHTFITTGNANQKLAEALSIEEMYALKPFLKDILGDTLREQDPNAAPDVAFDALIALKQTQEDLKESAAKGKLQQAAANSNHMTLEDNAVLKFYQEGLDIAQANTQQNTNPTQADSSNQHSTLYGQKQETSQPEKVRTAKQEIFEKAGKRSLEDAQALFKEMTTVLENEQKIGQGKFGETIAETKAKLEADTEARAVLERSGIVRDGATVYVPDDGGIMIDFGDVHGDFDVVKRIIETERFIENQETGDKKMKLVFYGDLVDRGAKSVELMEMLAALKTKYPEKIVIIGADHDVIYAPGLSPHDFPDKLIAHFGLLKGFNVSISETDVPGSQFENDVFDRAKESLPHDIRGLDKTDLAKAVARVLHLETGENPQTVDYNLIANEFNLPPHVLRQVVKLVELQALVAGSQGGPQTFLNMYEEMFRALPKERICGVLDTTHGGPPPQIMGIKKFAELASTDDVQAHIMYQAATWGDPITDLPDNTAQLQDVYGKLKKLYDSNTTAGETPDPSKTIQVQNVFTGSDMRWNTTWDLATIKLTMKKISSLFPTLDTGEPDFSHTNGVTVNVNRGGGSFINSLFMDHYYYNQNYLEAYLRRRGAKIYTRGHQTTDGLENGITQVAFDGQLITIHTTAMMGSESHPTYLVIDTSKTDQIGPANIKTSPQPI